MGLKPTAVCYSCFLGWNRDRGSHKCKSISSFDISQLSFLEIVYTHNESIGPEIK